MGRLPEDEIILLVNVVAGFGEAADSLESEDSRTLLEMMRAAFVNAALTDPMLIYALEALTALLPKVAAQAEWVIAAVAEKGLIGIGQCEDSRWAQDAFAFVNAVGSVEPAHAIVVAAAEGARAHIRVSECEDLMIECWGYLNHLIRNLLQVFEPFTEPVIEFVLGAEELSAPVLSNVACVLFDLLKVVQIDNDQAQHIVGLMAAGLRDDSEEGDFQNIGCCIVRVLDGHPKLQCPVELLFALVPYLTAIQNEDSSVR
jgi:hypothetical protein